MGRKRKHRRGKQRHEIEEQVFNLSGSNLMEVEMVRKVPRPPEEDPQEPTNDEKSSLEEDKPESREIKYAEYLSKHMHCGLE